MTAISEELTARDVDTGTSKGPIGFDFDQALQAVKALQEYFNRQSTNSSNPTDLFNDDRAIYLDIVMKKYPRHLPAVTFLEIVLPHPFHDPQTASSCLVVRDLDKHPRREQDRDKSARIYKEFFEEQHFAEFTQVLSASQLLTEYKTFDDRRKLCHTYDLFIADTRLGGNVTKWLGKEFVKTKRLPYLINVTKHAKRNFRRVFKLTRAVLTPCTLKFKVKLGRVNQPAEHLLANLRAVTKCLAIRMPGKWENVRSAYVSVPAFYELPVYVDWESSNAIKLPKPVKKEEDPFEEDIQSYEREMLADESDIGD